MIEHADDGDKMIPALNSKAIGWTLFQNYFCRFRLVRSQCSGPCVMSAGDGSHAALFSGLITDNKVLIINVDVRSPVVLSVKHCQLSQHQ